MSALDIPGLEGAQYAPPYIAPELYDAFRRAFRSGAPLPLTYVGAGMYGIVFCDKNNHAWKVMRLDTHARSGITGQVDRDFQLENAADEYEWLRDAAHTPIRDHVAKAYAVHAREIVLERECVLGRPGGWGDDRKLSDLHAKIEKTMLKFGWTAPEFKENSYIVTESGKAVLVDISQAIRVGHNLVGWVKDVLAGRRKTRSRWRDLAFVLLREDREGQDNLDGREVAAILRALIERDPEIATAFDMKDILGDS